MLCHQKIGCTFVAALVLLCLGWEVRAESISIVASDNASVNMNSPTSNESEAQTLKFQSNKCTYFRFDVSPLAGGTITSASLDLYWLSSEGAGYTEIPLCALNDLADAGLGTTETSWLGNLTWNTAPSGTEYPPNAYTSDLLGKLRVEKNHPAELLKFNLTSALPGLLESDTNNQLTLIVYGGGTKENRFASLANTGGYAVPTLKVGYEPIPEPGTLALLGMAFLGLSFYGWRRSRR